MGSLGGYVGRRMLQAIPLIVAAIVLNFSLIHLAPGDPARTLAGESGSATPEYVEQLRRDFGLDRPFYQQLGVYVGKVLQGDLGYSFRHRQSVAGLILERLPATLLLMGGALLVAVGGGTLLGIVAARRKGTWAATLISVGSLVAYATPMFWFGLMLIVLLSVKLRWLPTYGMATIGLDASPLGHVVDIAWHAVLPVTTLALFYLALYTRVMRVSLLEILNQEFITVARAKGLGDRPIIYRHALRNGLLGVTTIAGMQMGQLVGGSVVVETIFAWPGMGRLVFEAVAQRDYPMLLGALFVASITVVVMNLVTDVAYGMLDPRVRAAARA
jgi:peptide/nickel transport system permease protein